MRWNDPPGSAAPHSTSPLDAPGLLHWLACGRERRPDLRSLLETLDPKSRDELRHVLIRDHADRDAIASRLMRYRDEKGQHWADVIDFLTMYPEARRSVVRVLGELQAASD
jgi:hypothetical protein